MIRKLSATCSVGGILLSQNAFANDREHQVKTGFIYSIAKYCDWDLNHKPNSRFVVGVYRTRAYDLDIEVLNGKTLFGKTVSVEAIRSESEIANCQILIVGDVGADEIKHFVNLCRDSGTMLIGESKNFAKNGGTVGFVIRDGTVRFQVNLQSALQDRVNLQARLLILAEQVYR